jgi:hypothetical protein
MFWKEYLAVTRAIERRLDRRERVDEVETYRLERLLEQVSGVPQNEAKIRRLLDRIAAQPPLLRKEVVWEDERDLLRRQIESFTAATPVSAVEGEAARTLLKAVSFALQDKQQAMIYNPGSVNLLVRDVHGVLQASDLTINFKADRLPGYTSGEVASAFQLSRSTGNVATPALVQERLGAERALFGTAATQERTAPRQFSTSVMGRLAGPGLGTPTELDGMLNAARHRPKYAALNFCAYAQGSCPDPDYGRSFFVLRPEVKRRATYTYQDSFHAVEFELEDRYKLFSFNNLGLVLYPAAFYGDTPFIQSLLRRLPAHPGLGVQPAYLSGDSYIEAQIHGDVRFATDVAAVHLSRAEIDTLPLHHRDLVYARAKKFAQRWPGTAFQFH